MADEIIKRRDLLRQLDKIKLDDWIRAAKEVGFVVTQPTKGSSHYAIRRQGYPPTDIRGLVTLVYENLHKQDKPKTIKRLILAGADEDSFWRALDLLK